MRICGVRIWAASGGLKCCGFASSIRKLARSNVVVRSEPTALGRGEGTLGTGTLSEAESHSKTNAQATPSKTVRVRFGSLFGLRANARARSLRPITRTKSKTMANASPQRALKNAMFGRALPKTTE